VNKILDFNMFLDSIGMSTSAAALFILRKRKQNQHMITGTWNRFAPVFTSLFVFSYFMVAVGVVVKDVVPALIGCGLLLFFLGVYFVFYHKRKD
jgi:basic amino acid/polyamine antiporter, APA family